MVFAGMAMKPCHMRVQAIIPFQKEHGAAIVQLATWLRLWYPGCQMGRTSKSWREGWMGKNSGGGKKVSKKGKTQCVSMESSNRKKCSKAREMKKP